MTALRASISGVGTYRRTRCLNCSDCCTIVLLPSESERARKPDGAPRDKLGCSVLAQHRLPCNTEHQSRRRCIDLEPVDAHVVEFHFAELTGREAEACT